ncbi:MAG: hypothetical protein V3U21_01190, partial [Thermodesulfobacteriota bacterium]
MKRFIYFILIVSNISLCFSVSHAQNTTFEKYLAEKTPYDVKVPEGDTLINENEDAQLGAKDFLRDT